MAIPPSTGGHHHELVPDFEAALCKLPMNVPFFNGMFVTYGGIHYHVDDPQLQRALALQECQQPANKLDPPKAQEKKLKKKKMVKKKKNKSTVESSSTETSTQRARARDTDAEDAQIRRNRARAHDFSATSMGANNKLLRPSPPL
jgi:hypothetical protein